MKFSLSWLKAHLETEAPVAEITGVLNRIGLEVEDVEDRGAALAALPPRAARCFATAKPSRAFMPEE